MKIRMCVQLKVVLVCMDGCSDDAPKNSVKAAGCTELVRVVCQIFTLNSTIKP
jgi:hypothetical protein